MAQGNVVFDLLDRLLDQTRLGNVSWVATQRNFEWRFNGSEASIVLSSVDEDGYPPLSLAILNKDGRQTSSWTVSIVSEPDEEEFDSRVRELFTIVSSSNNPMLSLIRDLDNLPPF